MREKFGALNTLRHFLLKNPDRFTKSMGLKRAVNEVGD